jgi:hypothetical protein
MGLRTDTFGTASAFSGGYGYATAFGSSVTTARFCKVDVVFNGSRVARVNYSGPTGGLLTEGEQCAYAVSNCVGQSSKISYSVAPVLTAPQAILSQPVPAMAEPRTPVTIPAPFRRYDDVLRDTAR